MKKLLIAFILLSPFVQLAAQDKKDDKEQRREAKRNKINEMVKQEEEGVLVYNKQSIFGVEIRNLGYGVFYERSKSKTPLTSTLYNIEFTEIKHQKENRKFYLFQTPFKPYKINNFYQLKLGVGQQKVLGQKGNKNGVAVMGVYSGGLSVGLLRPYYVDIDDNGIITSIKYSKEDSAQFVDATNNGMVSGSSGLFKGWNEVKLKPGVYAKASLRFDWGRFNEIVSGLEAGVSAEFYTSKIPIMLYQKEKQFFFQGHIAILFGRRK